MDDALRQVARGEAAFKRAFLLGRFDERFGLPLGTTEGKGVGEQALALAYELVREAQEEAAGKARE